MRRERANMSIDDIRLDSKYDSIRKSKLSKSPKSPFKI
jgi:hypothetical protein